MNIYVFWAVMIIAFSVLEGITAQLVSIWFVAGSAAGLICAACNLSLPVQAAAAVGVSVLSLALTRPLVKKYITPRRERTNADRCIGQSAVVVSEINNINATGQVKANGSVWSARSENGRVIKEGEIVKIIKIEGVKLIVSPENSEE